MGVAPPNAASSKTDRYSATARLEVGSRSSILATLRRRCASATIMLASTAKASPSHNPFFHTARHDGLEELTQEIALTKPAVAVLGEGRMIGNVAVEPQSTEPPVRQIEGH